MKKPKAVEEPRLGLINPDQPTSLITLTLDEDVEKFINKVSKASNHTVSSVITVILTIQLEHAKATTKTQKKGGKK